MARARAWRTGSGHRVAAACSGPFPGREPIRATACDAGNAENSTRIVSGLRSGYSAGHNLSRRYDNSLYFGFNEVTVTRNGCPLSP